MPEPPPTSRRLSLELERDAAPIAGCLESENGGSWPFTGWLELARALDKAIADGPEEG